MTRVRRVALALLLSVMLVGSAVAGNVAATNHGAGAPEAADDVYVTDDGDVVLVYEEERGPDDTADGQFGADVDENLVYALITESVEEQPDVRWAFSALANPTAIRADGNLSMPQPDVVRSFDLAFTGTSTEEDSRSDLDLSATVADESGMGQFLQSITTDGEMTMGPDRFHATGNLSARTAMPLGQPSTNALTFRETDDGYELSVDQNRPLQSWQAEEWANRSAALQTIREQYAAVGSAGAGGNATVDLESYSLSEGQGDAQRLETSFTVTYTDVDESVRRLLATSLSQGPGLLATSLSQGPGDDEAAGRLADELLAADVQEISYNVTSQGGSYDVAFTVDVREYGDLMLAYFDYAQSMQPANTSTEAVEQARSQFEAQQAAGLEQHYTWTGELQGGQGANLTLDFALDYRTTNWAAYVDELQSRDLPWSRTEFALNGTTENERLAFEGSMSVEGERLYETTLEQFNQGMTAGAETPEWLPALTRSQPRSARLDASYDGNGLRVEAGAAFGNLSALRDAIAAEYGAPDVTEVVGRLDNDTATTYVRVGGAVSGDASEDDVRAMAFVGDETTVHMPGTYDREFPSMDTEQAREFVEAAESSGGAGPGFGPAVAVLALLALALLATRRT